jgi:hypothetical protein
VTKIAGSGSESGSTSQRHGSADPDPDPPQNFMDPEHCEKPLKTLCSGQIYKKNKKKQNQKNPLGCFFVFFLNRVFSNPDTREWTDGLFTHILRKIIDNVRGELDKRQWIIFDGDVDPEWVENLNSVLDVNKLFTLPNGERLSIPRNVRIMFEVTDLNHATHATVSRCGMVWFRQV